MKNVRTVDILGTKLSILDYELLISAVDKRIKKHTNFICAAPVHLLMESLENSSLQQGINRSLFTTTDGMPLVWIASALLKRKVKRIYGPILMLRLCKLAQKRKYKIFLLGGFGGLSNNLITNLKKKYPGITIVGAIETPLRPPTHKKNVDIIKKIRRSNADIVFVGMGCPIQEKWMIENYRKFETGLFVGVGAAFDFISGRIKQSPPFFQSLGLEWLYRLFQEPGRLWKRYLITNLKFIFTVLPRYKHFYETKTTIS